VDVYPGANTAVVTAFAFTATATTSSSVDSTVAIYTAGTVLAASVVRGTDIGGGSSAPRFRR
jgi:hypothetical protein